MTLRISISIIIVTVISSFSKCGGDQNISSHQPFEKDSIIVEDYKVIKKIINLDCCKIDTTEIKLGLYRVPQKDAGGLPGPLDYYLVSSLKLLSLDTIKLEKINTLKSSFKKDDIYFKEWLPESIKKSLFEMNSNESIEVNSAKMFYKAPYLNGFLVLLSDSSAYLFLSTM